MTRRSLFAMVAAALGLKLTPPPEPRLFPVDIPTEFDPEAFIEFKAAFLAEFDKVLDEEVANFKHFLGAVEVTSSLDQDGTIIEIHRDPVSGKVIKTVDCGRLFRG